MTKRKITFHTRYRYLTVKSHRKNVNGDVLRNEREKERKKQCLNVWEEGKKKRIKSQEEKKK